MKYIRHMIARIKYRTLKILCMLSPVSFSFDGKLVVLLFRTMYRYLESRVVCGRGRVNRVLAGMRKLKDPVRLLRWAKQRCCSWLQAASRFSVEGPSAGL